MKVIEEEHGEICQYLDEWLGIYNHLKNTFKSDKSKKEFKKRDTYAQLVSDTLSELLTSDAIKSGL